MSLPFRFFLVVSPSSAQLYGRLILFPWFHQPVKKQTSLTLRWKISAKLFPFTNVVFQALKSMFFLTLNFFAALQSAGFVTNHCSGKEPAKEQEQGRTREHGGKSGVHAVNLSPKSAKRNENSYAKRLTGRTRPLKVISPVIAVSDRVHRPLERKNKILIKAGKSNHKQGTEIWQYLGTMSQLEQQEKLSQNFAFRENLHPKPSLFFYLSKLLLSGCSQFKGVFVRRSMQSDCEWATLKLTVWTTFVDKNKIG